MSYNNINFLYALIKKIEYKINRPLNSNERQSVRDMMTHVFTPRNYRFDPNLTRLVFINTPQSILLNRLANRWIIIHLRT